jgi:serine protease Do
MLGLLIVACQMGSAALGLSPDEAQKLCDRVRPSLVVVRYVIEAEAGRREFSAPGVVVGREGLVATVSALFPSTIPDEQMRQFTIVVPGDTEQELPATFQGRDERSYLALLKTVTKQNWPVIEFADLPVRMAEPVVSIGLLPKEFGYKPYYAEAYVSAVLHASMPWVVVSADGLATVGSPVFNAQGQAIGLVQYPGRSAAEAGQGGAEGAALTRGPTPRLFVASRMFLPTLRDPPQGKPLHLPWLGTQLSALRKEVAEYYGLKNVPAAQVGVVVPDSPADKAGLKAGDKIIRLDGKPLERGDSLTETPNIFTRNLSWMKVGQKIRLTVLRGKGDPPVELSVTLGEQPRRANAAKRFYAEDLGLCLREIVFADTFANKLPADTKALVAAYIRPESSAASAGLRSGDVVKQMNGVAIESLEQWRRQYQEFRKSHPKQVVVLVAVRQGGTQVIRIEPPQ